MLDLIGINLYLETDRLLRPRGGQGFSEKCGVTKLYSPPTQKKKLHMEIVPPLVITIFIWNSQRRTQIHSKSLKKPLLRQKDDYTTQAR